MRRSIALSIVAGVLPIVSYTAWASDTVLEAETMVGVDGPFLGSFGNRIRGIRGGGRPWVLDKVEVVLDSDGSLKVEVEGLIIPAREGFGFDPAPFFQAIVSCLSVDSGVVTTVNISTTNGAEVMEEDLTNGDAKIEEDLDLPAPCVAPIVFVVGPAADPPWFAATGQP